MSKNKWPVLETENYARQRRQKAETQTEGFKGDISNHVKNSFVAESQVSLTCKTIYFI